MKFSRSLTFRLLHRSSAIILALFLILHLSNHFVGLAGQNGHIAYMEVIRPLYRNALIEPVLIALLIFQLATGVTMVLQGWRSRSGVVAWLQAVSGLYIAAFIVIHTTAVMGARFLLHLDTNFNFAAAGLHVPGWLWYFFPYYFLAVAALFAHVGCAIYWSFDDTRPRAASMALRVLIGVGVVSGVLFVLMLSGKLYPVTIPSKYLATYTG